MTKDVDISPISITPYSLASINTNNKPDSLPRPLIINDNTLFLNNYFTFSKYNNVILIFFLLLIYLIIQVLGYPNMISMELSKYL